MCYAAPPVNPAHNNPHGTAIGHTRGVGHSHHGHTAPTAPSAPAATPIQPLAPSILPAPALPSLSAPPTGSSPLKTPLPLAPKPSDSMNPFANPTTPSVSPMGTPGDKDSIEKDISNITDSIEKQNAVFDSGTTTDSISAESIINKVEEIIEPKAASFSTEQTPTKPAETPSGNQIPGGGRPSDVTLPPQAEGPPAETPSGNEIPGSNVPPVIPEEEPTTEPSPEPTPTDSGTEPSGTDTTTEPSDSTSESDTPTGPTTTSPSTDTSVTPLPQPVPTEPTTIPQPEPITIETLPASLPPIVIEENEGITPRVTAASLLGIDQASILSNEVIFTSYTSPLPMVVNTPNLFYESPLNILLFNNSEGVIGTSMGANIESTFTFNNVLDFYAASDSLNFLDTPMDLDPQEVNNFELAQINKPSIKDKGCKIVGKNLYDKIRKEFQQKLALKKLKCIINPNVKIEKDKEVVIEKEIVTNETTIKLVEKKL